ncbi:MAG TPA: GGDEF domain-containing protein, partial [Methylobacterium sp.]|nr:GGDEF domain-containing protein [Methylobacterium sp.]
MSLSRSGPIDGEFASLNQLRFSPPIEALFEKAGLPQRIELGRTTLAVATLLYDVFLLADWVILPDVLWPLTVMRLGIATPLALLIIWILPRSRHVWQVDGLLVWTSVLSVLMPSTIISFGTSHYVAIYQF